MKRCKACVATYSGGPGYVSPKHTEVCRRMRTGRGEPRKEWWDREPGYFYTEELPRELARAGRQWWPRAGSQIGERGGCFRRDLRDDKPLWAMSQREIVTELGRISRRLAGHEETEE